MIPIIAFLVTFIGFLIFTIRAILMQREMADEISRLPLDEPSITESEIDHV